LAAIKEFSDLGSGFRVAALDLEIRGAGNLLGAEQSGHIEAIGFDMYVKLLEQTVRELKGEEVEDERRAAVNLGIYLRIDERYISETNQRLAVYRQVGAARDEAQLAATLDGVTDRYGPMPGSVLRLAEYGRIRLLADRLGVESIDRERHLLVLKFRADAPLDPDRLIAFVQRRPDVTLTPPGVIRVDLDVAEEGRSDVRRPRHRLGAGSTSWWTKRATAGQVTDGFSKQALGEAGRGGGDDELLGRVSGLLAELSDEE
jgi:transcription-repair coupling factor (superfamily II helicase)